jgi:hypothetical protein
MKTRTIALTVAVVCFVGLTLSLAAENPNMGTWVLNEAKSKIPAGAPKNTKVVYEAAGDSVKVIVDGVDGQGKPIHNEWTGKLDGKDYPLVGDPSADTRGYKKISDRKTELTNKKDGKATTTGSIEISPDGKSRTLKVSGTDPKGNKVSYTAYYDKQ